MAIQNRRGRYADFDPNKMVDGEWAVVQEGQPGIGDGEAVYMAFRTGEVKRMATYEDMVANLEDAIEEAAEQAAEQATEQAETYASNASASATLAQSYAKGDTGSRPGETTDNASYYAQQAASSAAAARNSATDAYNSSTTASGHASNASGSATAATNSATAADDSRKEAEAWAVGTKDGTAVPSTDEQYHNNAKYWADDAAASAASLDAPTILGDFATYEQNSTASQAYDIGDYLVLNSVLYRVTAAISSGGTITPGTNVTQTDVAKEFERHKVLVITYSSFSSLPQTVTDSRITADHVVVNSVLGTPSAQTGDWTVTTADGSVSVSGSISGSTTLTLYLALQQ